MSKIHNGYYSYHLIETYIGSEKPVKIFCTKHGEFMQSLYNHAKKHGCKKCSDHIRVSRDFGIHREVFLNKFKEKFDSKLEITGNYVNNSTRIEYKCLKCNIKYENTPNKLLAKNNKGCAYCYGNGKNKQTIQYFEKYKGLLTKDIGYLYIVRLFNENENFIKIGITKEESCKTRFEKIPYRKDILFIQENNMYNCFKIEQLTLFNFKKHKYNPKTWFGGATELLDLKIYNDVESWVKLLMAESLNQI